MEVGEVYGSGEGVFEQRWLWGRSVVRCLSMSHSQCQGYRAEDG